MIQTPFVDEWVAEHALRCPDAAAVGAVDQPWTTYAQLAAWVEQLRGVLQANGVGPGAFVVQVLPASPVSIATALAVQAVGAGCVEISRDLGAAGIADVVRQTDARVVIASGRDAKMWGDIVIAAAVQHLLLIHPTPPPDKLVAQLSTVAWTWIPDRAPTDFSAGRSVPSPGRDPNSPALLVYTSGSTGKPRAVIQTHANIDANTRAIARYLNLTADDRAMATLPLFYCYGRSVLQTHLLVGGSVFFDHRSMYPAVVMEAIAQQHCTGFAGVPLTFENLRRQVSVTGTDYPSLRYVTQAGGPMRHDTVSWTRDAFAPAQLFVMYGQTEATARLSYLPPERAHDKAGSIGQGLDNIQLRVVDDDGNVVPAGSDGRIVASGPSITPGYFRAPDETRAIINEGWLDTGDLGYADDEGFIFITGRRSEFLKLSGNRVSATEIEEIIRRHDEVDDVAVVGGTDDAGAEQAAAFVVVAAHSAIDENDLRRHCRQAGPAFKVPKYVRFVDELPRTASNKIARAELQEWIKNDWNLLAGRAPTGSRGDGS